VLAAAGTAWPASTWQTWQVDTIAIRPADEHDLAGLLALYREAAEGNPLKTPASQDQAGPALKLILADPARHLCVAVAGTEVVGTADMLIVANLAHHGKPWAVIENVVVSASARRQGAGTALMRHLVDIASSAGCYKVQLLSAKHRSPAHELYRKAGFQPLAEGFRLYFDGTY
jgi:ribosomal protein S18 acetylase RimI-like enzyme